jgi:hypothetical protein
VKIETLGQPLNSQSPALRGRSSLWRLLAQLSSVETREGVSLAQGIKNFALRNSGRGIVVVVSDLMDKQGYEAALRYLVSRRMDVYVIHVLSPEELKPQIVGDLRLVDCEDDDVAEITVSAPLLARYNKTLEAFIGGAGEFCARRGMVYLLANSETLLDDLVGKYLRRRGLVR